MAAAGLEVDVPLVADRQVKLNVEYVLALGMPAITAALPGSIEPGRRVGEERARRNMWAATSPNPPP
jgi:hypothetical protein